MEKLNKYKRWNTQLHLYNDQYWDFVLSQDTTPFILLDGSYISKEECLAANIDFSDSGCVEENSVVSNPENVWENAVAEPSTLKDFGYVGMDNGRIIFDYSTATNKEFYEKITGTNLLIDDDKRLRLHKVTGNTHNYVYPLEYDAKNGCYTFKGGFFQGFYKLFGFDYQVLPQYIEKEWNLEFVLRPRNIEEDVKTINSKNGGKNKGIFFYMGTRAENKFVEFYDADMSRYRNRDESEYCDADNYFAFDWDEDSEIADSKFKAELIAFMLLSPFNCSCKTPCLSCRNYKDDDVYKQLAHICDAYFSDDYFTADEKEKEFRTSDGSIAKKGGYHEIETDNKFLTYDRTAHGLTTDKDDKDTVVKIYDYIRNDNENKFLTFNRTKKGKTVDTDVDPFYKYSLEDDILCNSFALRITEDGRLSYRYLIPDCENKIKIEEEFSYPGVIRPEQWSVINVKIEILNGNTDNCGKPMGERKMRIMFYVNGNLVFISKELPEFNFKELNEIYAKQEGVPFNISIGGGTQGLSEAVSIETKTPFKKILPIEENFSGTFIGDIKKFRFFTCELSLADIRNNFLYENLMPEIKYNATFIIDGVEYATVAYAAGDVIAYPDVPREGYILEWNKTYYVMPKHDIVLTGTYIEDTGNIVKIYCGSVLSNEVERFDDYSSLSVFECPIGTETSLSIAVSPNEEYATVEDYTEEEFQAWVNEHMYDYYILFPKDETLIYTFKNAAGADINTTVSIIDSEIVEINNTQYIKLHKLYAAQDNTLQIGTIKITVLKK